MQAEDLTSNECLQTRAKPLLGTLVQIRAQHRDATLISSIIDSAFACMQEVQDQLSPYSASSDIARINQMAHHQPIRIHEHTCHVVQMALELAVHTDGAFDPCIGAQLYSPKRHLSVTTPPTLTSCWRDIRLDLQHLQTRTPLLLDLNGIAKGYAVDCGIQHLRKAGCCAGSVNAGGDIRQFGPNSETVRVRLPSGRLFPILALQDMALASSCFDQQALTPEGFPMAILIDGNSRACVRDDSLIVVKAPRAMLADALTKVIALRPSLAPMLLKRYHASALRLHEEAEQVYITAI